MSSELMLFDSINKLIFQGSKKLSQIVLTNHKPGQFICDNQFFMIRSCDKSNQRDKSFWEQSFASLFSRKLSSCFLPIFFCFN